MTLSNRNPPTPEQSLMILRIIWAALLMGQLAFLVALVVVILPGQHSAHPQPILFWIDLAMLLTIVPVTFLIRMMIFRRAETESGIPASAYTTGNIIFWAGCEGVSFAGLVFAVLNGSLWPTIVIVVIAVALQLMTFPTGGQMSVSTDTGQRQ
jgi:hypothetical protein